MSIKSVLSTIVTGIYFVTNVAALHATESNFWAERRRGIQNKSGSPMFVAGLPSAQFSVGTNFLQQFPSIDRHALAPSLSATVTKTLPLNFTKENASLLRALSSSYGSIRKITLLPPRQRSLFAPLSTFRTFTKTLTLKKISAKLFNPWWTTIKWVSWHWRGLFIPSIFLGSDPSPGRTC
jgi:hypothetical protein